MGTYSVLGDPVFSPAHAVVIDGRAFFTASLKS